MNKATQVLTWEKLFTNILGQIKFFNEAIVIIVYNYIRNKCITCNDKEPPELNDHIKGLTNRKTKCLRSTLYLRKT